MAKKITTSTGSLSSSLSHRLKTPYFAGASNEALVRHGLPDDLGGFLVALALTLPGIPQERKYSKSGDHLFPEAEIPLPAEAADGIAADAKGPPFPDLAQLADQAGMPGGGAQALAARFVIRVVEAEGKFRLAEILRPERYEPVPELRVHNFNPLFRSRRAPVERQLPPPAPPARPAKDG